MIAEPAVTTATDAGMGLYAWRTFNRGEAIGVYSGKDLGTYEWDSDELVTALLSLVLELTNRPKLSVSVTLHS